MIRRRSKLRGPAHCPTCRFNMAADEDGTTWCPDGCADGSALTEWTNRLPEFGDDVRRFTKVGQLADAAMTENQKKGTAA
jgi:hypothetical protein